MTSRRIDRIVAGFYTTKLTRNGITVPVRFWQEGDEWRVEVNGRTHNADGSPLDPYEVWPTARESSEADYLFLERRRVWAERHQVEHPAAQPNLPIDLSKLPPRY